MFRSNFTIILSKLFFIMLLLQSKNYINEISLQSLVNIWVLTFLIYLKLKLCICRYLFSNSGVFEWQDTSYNGNFAFGQKMISDSQLYFLAVGAESPPLIHFVKVTFGNNAVDWSNILTWAYSSWYSYESESILSSDNTQIYSFFIINFASSTNLFYASFMILDGSVSGNRYISNNAENLGILLSRKRQFCRNSKLLIRFRTLPILSEKGPSSCVMGDPS